MPDEQIAKLPPYKKLLEISRDHGACRDFLKRAEKCETYQEAVGRQKISLIKWFNWLQNYFTAPARAEYEKVRAPARAEYEKVRAPAWAEYEKVRAPAWAEYGKVMDAARAEYEKVMDAAWAEYEKVMAPAWAEYEKVRAPALIQGVISSFG